MLPSLPEDRVKFVRDIVMSGVSDRVELEQGHRKTSEALKDIGRNFRDTRALLRILLGSKLSADLFDNETDETAEAILRRFYFLPKMDRDYIGNTIHMFSKPRDKVKYLSGLLKHPDYLLDRSVAQGITFPLPEA